MERIAGELEGVRIDLRDFRAVRPLVARTTVVVVCCPMCSSLDVLKRDWRAGAATVTWQCRPCRSRWREPAATGATGIRAALP
jgi:ribosomal protein L37AE/L43A